MVKSLALSSVIGRFAMMAAACVVTSGCGTVFNGADDALSVAERHPITVDRQTVTLEVPVEPSLNGLSRDMHAKLDGFLTAYRTRGHGPVTVTVPTNTGRDLDAQQTAANIRSALNSYGLDFAAMRGASYISNAPNAKVLVTFSRYVASGPECGAYINDALSRLNNQPSSDFGCASQTNLAAMVADPRDLTTMQPQAPVNGTVAAAAVRGVIMGQGTWQAENSLGTPITAAGQGGQGGQ